MTWSSVTVRSRAGRTKTFHLAVVRAEEEDVQDGVSALTGAALERPWATRNDAPEGRNDSRVGKICIKEVQLGFA
jgi:hypothetical protein